MLSSIKQWEKDTDVVPDIWCLFANYFRECCVKCGVSLLFICVQLESMSVVQVISVSGDVLLRSSVLGTAGRVIWYSTVSKPC